MGDRVKVLVRARPILGWEDETGWAVGEQNIHSLNTKSVRAKTSRSNLSQRHHQQQLQSYTFDFDTVIGPPMTSEKIYTQHIRPTLQVAISQCLHYSVIAYGATGSGKTYTMLGEQKTPGVLPCVLRDIFSLHRHSKHKHTIKLCYLEIYNEKLYDLLSAQTPEVKNPSSLSTHKVVSFNECLNVLAKGEENRSYGQRANHEHSSRSHTIFRICIDEWNEKMEKSSHVINVVDLAGSERLGEEGDRMETGFINRSLFQFSNVLSKLSQNKHQHIPFRDSKLTKLMEPSFGPDSLTFVIFCVSPAVETFPQTLSTLRLATKTKKITLPSEQPTKNSQSAEIQQLKQQLAEKQAYIQELQRKLAQLEHQLEKKSSQLESTHSIKGLVLVDHENVLLSLNKQEHNQASMEAVKSVFMKKITTLYEEYIESVVREEVGEEVWLKVEEICFINAIYKREDMQQYRIGVLEEILSDMNEAMEYYPLMKQYLQQLQNNHIKKELQQIEKEEVLGETVFMWGCEKDYRVCRADKKHKNGLKQLTSIGKVRDIGCGAHHTLVVSEVGEVLGWGRNNEQQLTGKTESVSMPRIIPSLVNVVSVACGWGHSLALTSQGQVYTWGYGADGQLGQGTTHNSPIPAALPHQHKVQYICAGHSHSGFIDECKHYYAFGFNRDYRLMVGQSREVLQPERVKLTGVVRAALGVSHSCVVTQEGKLYCGGVGTSGQLGVHLDSSITGYELMEAASKHVGEGVEKVCPMVEVEFFGNAVMDVGCGECMTGVIDNSRKLYTFGKSTYNRLGHTNPEITCILSDVDRVSIGYRHGFAHDLHRGRVYGWGFNIHHQVQAITSGDVDKPSLVHELSESGVMKLNCGFFHSTAIIK